MSPFFSIVIPTKNRPERVRDAIRSVLAQSFHDLELIVCDNSDPGYDSKIRSVAVAAGDPRLRYVRASGRLSMPDNWDLALSHATGKYVGVLTDRSVLRRDALQIAYDEIGRSGTAIVHWFSDHFGRDSRGRLFRQRPCSLNRFEFHSRDLLHYFVSGHPKFGAKMLPKLLSGVCERRVLDEIRCAVGRICLPASPDYTSAFLMLAHTRDVVLLDDALFVSCGVGNGSAFRRLHASAARFVSDIGLSWTDLVEFMPTRAMFTHGAVLNDFIRVKNALPSRFDGIDIDRSQYYLGCLFDYTRIARAGADRSADLDVLLEGLNREAPEVQRAVRRSHVYLTAVLMLPGASTEDPVGEEPARAVAREFEDVFDALAWAERHPRPRSLRPVLQMPSLHSLRTWDLGPNLGGHE